MTCFYYSVKQLLRVRQWFHEHPDGRICIPDLWPEVVLDWSMWRRWFVGCLMQKINREQTYRGRKDCDAWFLEMQRAARQLNQPRLAIRWLPLELRERFSDRLTD